MVQAPLTDHVFKVMQEAQSEKASEFAAQLGITCREDLDRKVDRLQQCARYMHAPPKIDPQLLWRDPGVTWITVFVHICEVSTVINSLSNEDIRIVCEKAKGKSSEWLAGILRRVSSKARQTSVTHMSATTILGNGEPESQMVPAACAAIADVNDTDIVRDPWVVRGKGPVKCDVCHAIVRRDVIARHKASAKCKAGHKTKNRSKQ